MAPSVWWSYKRPHLTSSANVLYMVANSNAMQGISSGVTIKYELAGWQKVMYGCDAAVAVIFVLGVVMLLRKKKHQKKD